MAGKIATRNAYGQALCDLAEKYPELVVLDADLANATMTKMFKAAYPDRFYDCGIAECNMTGIAARDGCRGLKPLQIPSRSLPPAALTTRYATPSLTPI